MHQVRKSNTISLFHILMSFIAGKLRPVEVTLPSILQPDEDEVYPEPSSSKGKRKAPAG